MNLKEKAKYRKKEILYNKKITKSIKNNNISSVVELLKQPYKSDFLIYESLNYCLENNYYKILDIILKKRKVKNIKIETSALSYGLLYGHFESCDVFLNYNFKFKDVESINVKVVTLANFNRIFEKKDIEKIDYFLKNIINNYITIEEIESIDGKYTKDMIELFNYRKKINNF